MARFLPQENQKARELMPNSSVVAFNKELPSLRLGVLRELAPASERLMNTLDNWLNDRALNVLERSWHPKYVLEVELELFRAACQDQPLYEPAVRGREESET